MLPFCPVQNNHKRKFPVSILLFNKLMDDILSKQPPPFFVHSNVPFIHSFIYLLQCIIKHIKIVRIVARHFRIPNL